MSRAATRRRYVFHRPGRPSVAVLAYSWRDAHRRLNSGAASTIVARGEVTQERRLAELAGQTGLRPVGTIIRSGAA